MNPATLVDVFLHLDRYVALVTDKLGVFAYVLLFAVILSETGIVFLPALPGDSLLFAAGAIAATGALNLWALLIGFSLAAIIGNILNYKTGRLIGAPLMRGDAFLGLHIKRSYLERTQAFFETHGGKAISLSRFAPIIRTYVPFVAGVTGMDWPTFVWWNVLGGTGWACLLTLLGFFFGNIPVIRERFSLVVIGIIVLSFVPAAVEWLKARRGGQNKEEASASS